MTIPMHNSNNTKKKPEENDIQDDPLDITTMMMIRTTARMLLPVSRSGLAVRRQAGKRKDLASIPLRLSFLLKNVVLCGHCLVTLSITSY